MSGKNVNRLFYVACLFLTGASASIVGICQENDRVSPQRDAALAELKALSADISRLPSQLSQAAAKVEIADAAWPINPAWSKSLLIDAYELTMEAEGSRKKGETQKQPIRSAVPISNAEDRARDLIRSRILSIAARDKTLLDELSGLSAKTLNKQERTLLYAELSRAALENGDVASATEHIAQSLQSDPIRGVSASLINDLAIRDRGAADELILRYFEFLRNATLSNGGFNSSQVFFALGQIIFPNSMFPDPNKHIPPPNPVVMVAYVRYVIDALTVLERQVPGSLMRNRNFLLSCWLPLKQYAPELTSAFLDLERLSRRSEQPASLPTKSYEERDNESYDKRKREATESDQPDFAAISSMISRGDFAEARKAIDKLTDEDRKPDLIERLNTEEAISVATKGEIHSAITLASKLKKATSMLRVFPAIVQRCVREKDQVCASTSVDQAVKQLRNSNTALAKPRVPLPTEFVVSEREIDPVVQSLGLLAISLSRLDKSLSLDVLDEMVLAANKTVVDPDLGRVPFSASLFSKLAELDEIRVQQAAANLNSPLQKIVALAATYKSRISRITEGSGRKLSQASRPGSVHVGFG